MPVIPGLFDESVDSQDSKVVADLFDNSVKFIPNLFGGEELPPENVDANTPGAVLLPNGKYGIPINQNPQTDIFKETASPSIDLPGAELKAPEEKPAFQKFKDSIISVFKEAPEMQTAKAQNVYAISKVTGIPMEKVNENYDALVRQPSVTGMTFADPTPMEVASMALILPIASAAASNPVGVAVGVASFMAADELENFATSIIKKEPYQAGAGKGIKEFFPKDLNEETKTAIELGDFLMKGAAIGAIGKRFPSVAEKITTQVSDKYNLPKTVTLTNQEFRDIFNKPESNPKAAELIKDLGLPGETLSRIAREGKGIAVQIPVEKITTISDRAWWKSVKEFFGVKSEPIIKTERQTPVQKQVLGILEHQDISKYNNILAESNKLLDKASNSGKIADWNAYHASLDAYHKAILEGKPLVIKNLFIEDSSFKKAMASASFAPGDYVPTEEEINKLVSETLKDAKPGNKIIFMAGATASGKSSIVRGIQAEEKIPIIDPDIYKEKFLGYTPEKANLYHEASSVVNRVAVDKAIESGVSFINVITGRNSEKFSKLMDDLKSQGKDTKVNFIYVDLPESLRRMEQRKASKKGINVPPESVEAIYKGSLNTLFESFIPKAKSVDLLENPFNPAGRAEAKSVAQFENGKLVNIDDKNALAKIIRNRYTSNGEVITDEQLNKEIANLRRSGQPASQSTGQGESSLLQSDVKEGPQSAGASSGRYQELNATANQPIGSEGQSYLKTAFEKVLSESGVTISPFTGSEPTKGYVFAESKSTEFSVDEKDFNESTISEYIKNNQKELSQPNRYLGIWKDSGKVYLDVSTVNSNLDSALEKATRAKQLAIFDLNKKESIETGLRKVEPTGERKKSRAFERAKEQYAEALLLQPSVTYTEINIADVMARAFDFVEKEPALAKKVVYAMAPAPYGIPETAVSIAYNEKMKEEGNVKEYINSYRSRSLRQTQRGQEIVLEKAAAINQNDPLNFINQVVKARMEQAGKKIWSISAKKDAPTARSRAFEKIKNESKSIKSEVIDPKKLDINEAQKIINSIICP